MTSITNLVSPNAGGPGLRALLQIQACEPAAPETSPSAGSLLPSDGRGVRGEGSGGGEGRGEGGTAVLDFISSDETLDRYDEIIRASGWRLDTYRRNPVFQNAHQYGDILFTLGKALITEVRSGPPRTPNPELSAHLFQRIQFATDVNPIARIAYGLYKGKFLNAVSVGFIPLRWLDANGTEHAAGSSEFQDFSVSASQNFQRQYLEQELLEVSAVGIPANPNALALGLKFGAIEKADLRETLDLLKSLGGSENAGAPFGTSSKPLICNLQLLFLARELRRILRRS